MNKLLEIGKTVKELECIFKAIIIRNSIYKDSYDKFDEKVEFIEKTINELLEKEMSNNNIPNNQAMEELDKAISEIKEPNEWTEQDIENMIQEFKEIVDDNSTNGFIYYLQKLKLTKYGKDNGS